MGIYSLLIFGIWSVILGFGFFEYKEALTGQVFYVEIVDTFLMTMAILTVVWIYWVKIQRKSFISIGFPKSRWIIKELIMGLGTGIILISGTFLL
jgi:hypothetical protein